MIYRILLALHVISIICWMAGILYLIRLFVYHAAETEEVVKSRFKIMERRLYKYITVPAMLSSFVFGIAIIGHNPSLFSYPWLQLKLVLVILLAGCTGMSGKIVKQFANDTCQRSEKFFRVFNEIPTLLMVAIVFLAILKPWM